MAIPQAHLHTDPAAAGADPFDHPVYIDGVLAKRVVAFAIDGALILATFAALWVLFGIVAVFSLFLLTLSLNVTVVAIAYFSGFTGLGRRATPGMAALGLELRRWDGGVPDLAQAILRVILHWASIVVLTPLVLVVALFDSKRRLLHDLLSGTVVVNRWPLADEVD